MLLNSGIEKMQKEKLKDSKFSIIYSKKGDIKNVIINFGKYKGISINKIIEEQRSYLYWILDNIDDIPNEVNDFIVQMLEETASTYTKNNDY